MATSLVISQNPLFILRGRTIIRNNLLASTGSIVILKIHPIREHNTNAEISSDTKF